MNGYAITREEHYKRYLTFKSIPHGPFRGCSRMEAKRPHVPKICYTYPTMMKLITVVPYYPKEDPKNI